MSSLFRNKFEHGSTATSPNVSALCSFLTRLTNFRFNWWMPSDRLLTSTNELTRWIRERASFCSWGNFFTNLNAYWLFFSNAAGNAIAKQTLDHYNNGEPREQITHKEMEEIIKLSAYNEGDGGLKKSELVARHLIDAYVPFLPLERKHVRMCIVDYMKSRGYRITDERVDAIINELTVSFWNWTLSWEFEHY